MLKKQCCVCALFLIINLSIEGDSGSWSATPVDTFWDNDANWTGAAFPNGVAETAAFAGYNAAGAIDSTTDVTVGALYLDSPTSSVSLEFSGGHTITFDKSTAGQNVSNILIPSNQTHNLRTRSILNSDLIIYAGEGSSLNVDESVTGTGSVSFVVARDTHINYNARNFYNGDTILRSGFLDVNGPGTTINIPGDVYIYGAAILKHDPSVSNNFAPDITMNIEAGQYNINSTTQTIGSMILTKGASVYSENPGSDLRLTSTSAALIIGDNSYMQSDTLTLVNGGAIVHNGAQQGEGFFLGVSLPAGFMTIDLNGNNNVPIFVANNALQGGNEFDLDFFDVKFVNGSLNKLGDGTIVFDGTQGCIPDLMISSGSVQIGRSGLPANLEGCSPYGMSTITIEADTTLQGFGTLGTVSQQIAIINTAGIQVIGSQFMPGTLTITGDYTQLSNGILAVQGFSTTAINQLVVNTGGVTLDGGLIFLAVAGSNFSNGDEIVIIDNNGGSGITGTFSFLLAEVPNGLSARLIYSSNEVRLRFETCEPLRNNFIRKDAVLFYNLKGFIKNLCNIVVR